MKRSTIVVLCGGKSAEKLVSLVSAQCVVAHLDTQRFRIRLIHIGADNSWVEVSPRRLLAETPENLHRGGATLSRLRQGSRSVDPWILLTSMSQSDCVFPVLHGPMGEDGTIQGLLELTGAAYVGCGVFGSAAGMDKESTKRLAQSIGLPQVPWASVRSSREALAVANRLGPLPSFAGVLRPLHVDPPAFAKITGLPDGTIKNYLFRARKKLRDNLLLNYNKEDL